MKFKGYSLINLNNNYYYKTYNLKQKITILCEAYSAIYFLHEYIDYINIIL